MSASLQQTPLPNNPYDLANQQDWYRAFDACKWLEAADNWGKFLPDLAKTHSEVIMLQTNPQVAGRTLGYALILAPSDVGRDAVARAVNDCNGNAEILAGLAHLYIYGLIRICE